MYIFLSTFDNNHRADYAFIYLLHILHININLKEKQAHSLFLIQGHTKNYLLSRGFKISQETTTINVNVACNRAHCGPKKIQLAI